MLTLVFPLNLSMLLLLQPHRMESFFEKGQISEEETSDTKMNSKEKVYLSLNSSLKMCSEAFLWLFQFHIE